MLTRAAARSLRPYRIPSTPIQATTPSFQSRSYAKNSKPKRPFEYKAPSGSIPTNRYGPNTQRPTGPAAGTIPQQSYEENSWHSNPSELPDISKLQGEFDSLMRTTLSNPPSKTKHEINPTSSLPSKANPHPEYSKLQDDFETSAIDLAEARRQEREQEPTRPLPDLTQGIPSTLDSELASSSSKSDPASTNITEDPSGPGGEGGGDLPKTAYISSFERRRSRVARWLFGSVATSVIVGTVYSGRNWDTEEEELRHLESPSGWGLGLFYGRAMARFHDLLDYYNEPAFPKLLPNTDPTWERPYTLVLSLEDMLVHSEWSREHGWRMAKRPGVDYFLRYLSQYYEIVVFTSVPSMIGHPIIQKLDPYRIGIMWPLFREATRYRKGEYIKDLSFLNRDLNKIIMIDTVPAHAKLQPENAIIVPKWKGDLRDKELVSFIPFLEYVASMGIDDTRDVLKSFEGKHIPTEFAQREAVVRERFQKQLADEKAKRPRRSIGFLGNALGMKPQGGVDGMEQSLSEGFEQGKTFQDQVRERGQKQYEILEKEIREKGEEWLKQMAEDEKKMTDEAMKGMKSSITGVFPFSGGGGGGKQS